MEPLEWTLVTTTLMLIFVVFAINPIQVAINDAIQNDAQLQAQRLASTINLLSTAPEGTLYTYEMPEATCKATITDSLVSLTVNQTTSTVTSVVSLIKTGTKISNGEFQCRRSLEMTRVGNELRIR